MDKPPWKQVTAWAERPHSWTEISFSQVISPVPQIEQFKIDTTWEFLIVATDGVNQNLYLKQKIFWWRNMLKVWDAVTNNEALNFVKSKIENKLRWVFHSWAKTFNENQNEINCFLT